MVQTADTGQIDTATVARPGTNTNAGYAIFRFDDALQSTAPYFVRLDFGTGSAANAPRVQVTIGTGSNGSGTITGVVQAAMSIGQNAGSTAAFQNTATAYPSYACGHAGTISIAFKVGAANNGTHFFMAFHRVRATDGSQSEDGLAFIYCHYTTNSPSPSMRVYRRINPVMIGGDQANTFCLVPLLVTSSQPGGNPMAYRHFLSLPEQRPLLESMTVIASEVGAGSTFQSRPIGSTDRTYISVGRSCGNCAAGANGAGSDYSLAMLYD